MFMRFLLAASAIVLASGIARAADMVDTPVADWTGFYLGVNGGYGGGTFDYPMSVDGVILGDLDSYDFGADITASGFFGGVQAGWNWQADKLVLGVEGDIALSDIKSELEVYSDTANASISGGSTIDWFGTARLRAGFLATDELLIYATGGLAWGSVTAEYDLDLGQIGQIDDDTSESHMGWTIGAGFEYKVTENISLKTEYLYVDLGESTLLDDQYGSCGDSYCLGLKIDQDIAFHTVKAGVNYRF